MSIPPADIPPERLFSLLLALCPTAPLKATLEGFALEVHAMHSQAYAAAWFAAQEAPAEVRRARYQREILARCMWSGGERLSADDLGLLDASELAPIADEALTVLARINPTYRDDWQAWQARLEEGARHPLNASAGVALAACVDYGHGAVVYRPDRAYGLPMRELLDGHWFCFRAARAAWSDDDKPKSIAEALRQAQTRRS